MTKHTVYGFFYDHWETFGETVEAETGETAARIVLERHGSDARIVAVVAGEPEDTYRFGAVLSLENWNTTA